MARAPPQTPLGELTALPRPPRLDLRGPTSKGRGREGRGGLPVRGGRGGGDGRKGEGRERRRVEGEDRREGEGRSGRGRMSGFSSQPTWQP